MSDGREGPAAAGPGGRGDGAGDARAGRGEGHGAGADDAGAAGLLAEALDRMAHQIKNPLQAVAMNLEVIRMRVRKDAPGLWEELERFAGAVDANVGLLDRRLRLLMSLGRRSTDDPPESVDVTALIRDFASALRLDAEPPALRVEAEGPEIAAEARPGHVLALVLEAWDRAERAAEPAEELAVRVRRGGDEVRLELPLRGAPPDRWRRLAAAAGGRLEEVGDGGGVALVLPRG